MNPFRSVYTPDQERRLQRGRDALLARWSRAPFSDGQTPTYGVEAGDVMMNEQQVVDRFAISGASPGMTPAWERELAQMGLRAEHVSGSKFHVYVAHSELMRRTRCLPCSIDAACVQFTVMHASAALGLAYLAYCCLA